MTGPWIFHEAGEAPCGCSFAMSVYHDAAAFPDGHRYRGAAWAGTERLTVARCAEHGGRRTDLEKGPPPLGRAVGDPDPTVDAAGGEGDFCLARGPKGYFLCTWLTGHDGDHVAGTGDVIAEVWS